ncbi:Pr6Pr family membrane protein [Sphingobacterium sp. E70]|uniref:Pr6Pr family membrane protein n=1 Tax=Sphingobacterium sp. E70 TaxID=2853439 RepID=UPI00359C661C
MIDQRIIHWRSIFNWLLYPFVYLLYTLWHGALSGFYPYPFVDVSELGMNSVLTNSVIITVAFLLIGLLLIRINRRIAQKGSKCTRTKSNRNILRIYFYLHQEGASL